jgi:RHS repeat-associated protein
MLAAAKDESVPLLAASLLSENSCPGFGGCDLELHRVIELANSLNASGLATSLYDDGRRSRSTGKERDSESGLDYFGARYYGSALGRYMSPDWSAKEEPVPYAKLGDPQTLNLYSYVQNNPLARFDDDGHETQTYLGAPGYEAQLENDKHISSTEWKVWGGVGLGAAALSGAGEIAALARVGWTAALGWALGNPGQVQNVVNMAADAVAPPGSPSFSSMGSWVSESVAGSSASALAYEEQITGSAGSAFRVNGVNFDGVSSAGLQEAKGPGYEKLLNSSFGSSVADKLLGQATSQLKAANGAPITWSFAEQGAAKAVRSLFQKQGIKGINVVYVAPE